MATQKEEKHQLNITIQVSTYTQTTRIHDMSAFAYASTCPRDKRSKHTLFLVLTKVHSQVSQHYNKLIIHKSFKDRVSQACNTLGVCHQLSSGFELKHDWSSGVEDVKVKCMKLSSARIWIKHIVYMITLFKICVWVMLMELISCASHHSLSIVLTGKVSWCLESKSHMKW